MPLGIAREHTPAPSVYSFTSACRLTPLSTLDEMPSFTPYASAPVPSSSKANSAAPLPSSFSASSSSPFKPSMSRRDSIYSTCSTSCSTCCDSDCDAASGWESSSSDEDLDLIATPEVRAVDTGSSRKGKGKETPEDLTASFHAFSLSDAAIDWQIPLAPVNPTLPLPPLTPSSAFARDAQPTTTTSSSSSSTSQRATTHPRPLPDSPPTRAVPSAEQEQEEEANNRGRSRWPRLLWRSDLDDDSLAVLKDYHVRAVGGPLPTLRRGMREREVARWSRRMEDAGL
ncbi:hypothetical protein JCM8547_000341 [Rhodosporidiobolus lusitaniae]